MTDQDTRDRIAQFDRSIERTEDNLSVHQRAVRRTEDILDDLRRQRAAIAVVGRDDGDRIDAALKGDGGE